jgi:hypothetical protein
MIAAYGQEGRGAMSKYEPLREHLEKCGYSPVPMSFTEIERILGFALPPSSRRYRAWWSNNPSNSAITHAWLDAGFQSEQVDIEGRRVVFRRAASSADAGSQKPGRHPLLGCMKGTVTFASDFQPGEPADPEWGEAAYGGDA